MSVVDVTSGAERVADEVQHLDAIDCFGNGHRFIKYVLLSDEGVFLEILADLAVSHLSGDFIILAGVLGFLNRAGSDGFNFFSGHIIGINPEGIMEDDVLADSLEYIVRCVAFHLEQAGTLAVVVDVLAERATLDDAPANTYTHEMMCQIDECVVKARFDKSVEVIVITGAGEKFFCAGANIGMLQKADPDWKYSFCLHANETLNRLEQTPKLVIAALNGHTVGGGLEIAMAADIRIARKDSGKVGLPEVALGVLPGTGGTQRLVRLVHPPCAGKGCESCFGAGLLGRTGIFELIVVNDEIRHLIADGAELEALRKAARNTGKRGLAEEGRRLVESGKTTAVEVARVVQATQ